MQIAAVKGTKEKKIWIPIWPSAALCLCLSSDQWWHGWWFFHTHPLDSPSHRGSALSPPLHTLPLFLWYVILKEGNITVTHIHSTEKRLNRAFIFLCKLSWHIFQTTKFCFLLQRENLCVHMPMKCLGITVCNNYSLVPLLCRHQYGQHTGGWSSVVQLREQYLKAGAVCRSSLIDMVMTASE